MLQAGDAAGRRLVGLRDVDAQSQHRQSQYKLSQREQASFCYELPGLLAAISYHDLGDKRSYLAARRGFF